eukprot:8671392-Pyramimonas_sp.AAC.1
MFDVRAPDPQDAWVFFDGLGLGLLLPHGRGPARPHRPLPSRRCRRGPQVRCDDNVTPVRRLEKGRAS